MYTNAAVTDSEAASTVNSYADNGGYNSFSDKSIRNGFIRKVIT